MKWAALLLALLLSMGEIVHSARILAVLPLPSKSHSIWHHALFRVLAQHGHQVVLYSAFPPPSLMENITVHHLHTSLLDETNEWSFEEFTNVYNMKYFGFTITSIWEKVLPMCEDTFKTEKIKDLLQSNEKFDLVVIEPAVAQESMLVFGHKFKAPVINLQGFGTWSLLDWVTGNSLSISHIPEVISFPFTNNMSFVERLRNFVSTVLTILFYHFDYLPRQQNLIDKYYKDPSVPPITDMLRDISITLSNTHKTLEYPRPYTPNLIPIGGAHVSSHTTPLPQNIKEFLNQSKKGFIFFSLGTLVPTHKFPREVIQAFVRALGNLPVNVLWKIDADSLPGLPNNVMLTKWVPQPTVLAHPNCMLFMTHGGLFSQHETLYAGVPVVGIPFLADQWYNMGFYEHLGVGVTLDFTTITEETVRKAVTTVLSNTRFKENARKMSRIIRDVPIPPAESLVFWVEYVLRHGGAQHLKPASAGLSWYKLTLVDILAVVLATTLAIIFILYIVIKILLKMCFGGKINNVLSIKKVN